MSRLSLLASAFLSRPVTCGSLQLRPLPAGAVMLLMESGNPFFADKPTEPTEAQRMQALMEIIYILAAPLEDLAMACATPGDYTALRRAALVMGQSIPLDAFSAFVDQFAVIQQTIQAAVITLHEESLPGKPVPSPTGSPISSISSGRPATLSGNSISFGTSPSPSPSNISTPPASPPAPSAAGPSPSPDPETLPHPGESFLPLP